MRIAIAAGWLRWRDISGALLRHSGRGSRNHDSLVMIADGESAEQRGSE